MSAINVLSQQQNVGRVTDGYPSRLRATRDGAPIVLPWYEALVMEGVVYQAKAGSGVTAISPMITYADTSKTILYDSASSLALIPLVVHFAFLATGAVAIHAFAIVSATASGAGTSTAITARNLRTDVTTASGSAAVAHTATGATDNIDGSERELFRFATNQDLDATGISPVVHWAAGDQEVTPICVGVGSFDLAVVTPTSGTGFGYLVAAELPSTAFS